MLTFLHPLVDFCSVSVLVLGGFSYERWIAYGVLAFALEFPLGMLLDLRREWIRGVLAVGGALTVCGAATAVVGVVGWFPLVSACVGNALFHLSAGSWVMDRTSDRAGPIGLFISTGALGLAGGQYVAGRGWGVLIACVAALLVVGTCLWFCLIARAPSPPPHRTARALACGVGACPPGVRPCSLFLCSAAILVLFVVIAWRSWAGLLATGQTQGLGTALVIAAAAVTWAGKAAGGFTADFAARIPRLGCVGGNVLVTLVSVAGSGALFLCSPEQAAMWLGLLFLAQFATGPVLALMRRACGGRSGTAFGLNCLGLFTGSLGVA